MCIKGASRGDVSFTHNKHNILNNSQIGPISSESNVFEIYFELGGILKNQSSIFRGFTVHNSISLTNIFKYFRFAKELALHQNDN